MQKFTNILMLFLVFLGLKPNLLGQIDTIALKQEIKAIKSTKDHKAFWSEINKLDQTFRGSMTNDSIDKLNLIKCCLYFNEFGFPNRDIAGEKSSIISMVWIHNKYPEVSHISFPIIMEGYAKNELSKSEVRDYYLRNLFTRKNPTVLEHSDHTMSEILETVQPALKAPINIKALLESYNREEAFLKQKHTNVGSWYAEATYDTILFNEKPLIRKRVSNPIVIFQDSSKEFYYRNIYEDGSHYPQHFEVVSEDVKSFRLFKNSKKSFVITNTGDLEIHNEGKIERKYKRKQE